MKTIRIELEGRNWKSLLVDLASYEENLARDLRMINNSLNYYKGKGEKGIEEFEKTLRKYKEREEGFKTMKPKIQNHSSISLSDQEYSEFIRVLVHEIEHGKSRLEDYKDGTFGFGYKMMIPHEEKDIQRRIQMYEELEGKKYVFNEDEMW